MQHRTIAVYLLVALVGAERLSSGSSEASASSNHAGTAENKSEEKRSNLRKDRDVTASNTDARLVVPEECRVAFGSLPSEAAFSKPITLGATIGHDDTAEITHSAGNTALKGAGVRVHYHDYGEPSNPSGWGNVHASFDAESPGSDHKKMYASGFLEGASTFERINDFYHNTRVSPGLRRALNGVFFEPQLSELRASFNKDSSDFWHQVGGMTCQLYGMADGYKARRAQNPVDDDTPELDVYDFMRFNSDGQIPELQSKIEDEQSLIELYKMSTPTNSFLEMYPGDERFRRGVEYGDYPGRCSALVRYTNHDKADATSDLLLGHTTFEDYKEAIRMWKRYQFPTRGAHSTLLSFSSYPGCATSTDDYFVTDKGLALTETTLNVRNRENAKNYVHTPHISDYAQVLANLRVAKSGKDYVERSLASLTGLYTSQWLMVDYNKFQDGRPQPGTLYVLETGPGEKEKAERASLLEKAEGGPYQVDITPSGSAVVFDATKSLLEKGYFSSYNEPQLNPMPEIEGARSDPREGIFDIHAPMVNTREDMMRIMRRCNKEEDQVAYLHAIACRGDLDNDWNQFGGVDGKVTDTSLMFAKDGPSAVAVMGPTQEVNNRCEPFSFTGRVPRGVQKDMNFGWYTMAPDSTTAYKGYSNACDQQADQQAVAAAVTHGGDLDSVLDGEDSNEFGTDSIDVALSASGHVDRTA